MDRAATADTRLLYCTTGIVLRMCLGDHALRHVSHIVIDEVHERSVDTDVLMVILRQVARACHALSVFNNMSDYACCVEQCCMLCLCCACATENSVLHRDV
jgi:hypothetical protein